MFTASHVHIRDNGAGPEHVTSHNGGEGSYNMPLEGSLYICLISKSASTPLRTPKDPQVDPQDFSCTTFLYYCKRDHKLMSISFPPSLCKSDYYRLVMIIHLRGVTRIS